MQDEVFGKDEVIFDSRKDGPAPSAVDRLIPWLEAILGKIPEDRRGTARFLARTGENIPVTGRQNKNDHFRYTELWHEVIYTREHTEQELAELKAAYDATNPAEERHARKVSESRLRQHGSAAKIEGAHKKAAFYASTAMRALRKANGHYRAMLPENKGISEAIASEIGA